MKQSLFITLLLSLFSTQVFAVDLCDDECTIVIDFPSGGTLKALAPMTFSFGDNGLVDYAPGSTAYVNGNTLILNTDDELTFGAGGYLDIGDAGNITYSDIELSSNSEIVFTIGAVGDTTTVTIENFTVTGDVVFEVNGANLVLGGLDIDGELTVNAEGNITGTEVISITGVLNLTAENHLVLNSLSVGGALGVTAGGNITQTAAVNVIGAATLLTTGGDINLGNSGNQFNTVNITANTGSVNMSTGFVETNVQCSSGDSGATVSSGPTPALNSPLTLCESGVLNTTALNDAGFLILPLGSEIVLSNLIVENPDPELSEQQTLSTEKSGSTQIFYLLLLSSFLFFRTHSFRA